MLLITADTTDGYTADSTYVSADSTQLPQPTRIPKTFFTPERRDPDGSFSFSIPNTTYGSTKLNP